MTTEQPNKTRKQPTYIAYTVREDAEGKKGYFNRIGAAWTHKDGKGFDIRLDALPVDGRICLRELTEQVSE